MKIWQVVVPGLFGLTLAGCQSDPSIALLERDNFKKEQEINRLSYENQELKEALEAVGRPSMAGRRGNRRPNRARAIAAGRLPRRAVLVHRPRRRPDRTPSRMPRPRVVSMSRQARKYLRVRFPTG